MAQKFELFVFLSLPFAEILSDLLGFLTSQSVNMHMLEKIEFPAKYRLCYDLCCVHSVFDVRPELNVSFPGVDNIDRILPVG